MSQNIPIYIPTYISNAAYIPARVLPRLLFYNGQIECETYYIADGSNIGYAQNTFPYFDNYNVVTGSFPTIDSESLLFTNETAVYGDAPYNSLYINYWDTYISLLYNPKTRLLNASAIIPLADYVKMELNDVVNFKGNYYHLRAINDYSLKTGQCSIQLLGPIIGDTFSQGISVTPECCTPTFNTITQNTTTLTLGFTLGTGTCLSCISATLQSSTNGTTWGNNVTISCTSPISIAIPNVPTYYRIITNCGAKVSSPSNSLFYNPNGYTITNCSSSVSIEVSFFGGRPTNNVFVSSDLFSGCWSIGNLYSGSLDYTNIVNDGEFLNCTTCLNSAYCLEYRIENNTETSVGISYYDCSGVYVSDNLGSGNQITFCANTTYGPIETGGATLFTVGDCP